MAQQKRLVAVGQAEAFASASDALDPQAGGVQATARRRRFVFVKCHAFLADWTDMADGAFIPDVDGPDLARRRVRRFPLPLWARPGDPPGAARSRRVILLTALLAVTNAFDLAFTMLARNHDQFWEQNPIARLIIDNTPAFFAFKILLVLFGIVVILRFRRMLLTEVLSWIACGVYSSLVFIWWRFFAALG